MDDLRDTYAQMETEELIRIITDDSGDYTEPAIQYAKDELEIRGVATGKSLHDTTAAKAEECSPAKSTIKSNSLRDTSLRTGYKSSDIKAKVVLLLIGVACLYWASVLVMASWFCYKDVKRHSLAVGILFSPTISVLRATNWPYYVLLGAKTIPAVRAERQHYTVTCRVPLPMMQLDLISKPTRQQEDMLCSCIWSNLDEKDRAIARALRENRAAPSDAYDSHLTELLEYCGAGRL